MSSNYFYFYVILFADRVSCNQCNYTSCKCFTLKASKERGKLMYFTMLDVLSFLDGFRAEVTEVKKKKNLKLHGEATALD